MIKCEKKMKREGKLWQLVKRIKHVATLSKLEISDEEIAMFTEQLGDIIDMVEYLDEVDTTGVLLQ